MLILSIDCGGNVSVDEGHGFIQTRNYPIKYDGPPAGTATRACYWYITVKPNHQILFSFLSFLIEGNPACKLPLSHHTYLKSSDVHSR